MMDHILQPWGDKWALEDVKGSWYMDDVLVASRDKKKHQQATHELLDILEANDLFLKTREIHVGTTMRQLSGANP